jgi:hypothetical protein
MRPASDIATCMYYTGIHLFTKKPVKIAKGMQNRKMQQALMQFFKPENYFTVREALIQAGRANLIGSGCDCLIPAQPPKKAIEARQRRANQATRGEEVEGDHYHALAHPSRARSRANVASTRTEEGLPSGQEVAAAAKKEEARQVSHARPGHAEACPGNQSVDLARSHGPLVSELGRLCTLPRRRCQGPGRGVKARAYQDAPPLRSM